MIDEYTNREKILHYCEHDFLECVWGFLMMQTMEVYGKNVFEKIIDYVVETREKYYKEVRKDEKAKRYIGEWAKARREKIEEIFQTCTKFPESGDEG
ncbi:MAG: hypothetical protein GTN76_06280 [Candidatus Aenigmarchaeota archaeon]|nr:hypothetical protein [Candidatus Aenigmarchaeota archaeon]